MERLYELVRSPLSAIDRFHQEIQTIFAEQQRPADELSQQVDSVREQVYQDAEARFREFGREGADAVEEELLRNLQQVKEVRARANVVGGLVRSVFRPAE